MNFLETFGILLLFVVTISFIIKLLRQPIILGYILSGFLFSLFLISDSINTEYILALSEVGVTLLLFLMGLEFNLKSLNELGKDVIVSSIIQSIVYFLVAFGLSLLFGFTVFESVYLGIFFMFASTLVATKWLEDKKDLLTLHGKIVLGTLIFQDIIAILSLTALNAFKHNSLSGFLTLPLFGIILFLIAFILSKYGLNPLLKFSSKYPELLFIVGLGVCFLCVIISPMLGYSAAIGAFIAGVTLANTSYRIEISTKLKSLIIFFNMLFFVGLGFKINVGIPHYQWWYVFIILVLSIFFKPVVTYMTLRWRGFDIKTSYTSSMYLGHLSEFGIIIIAAGVSLDLINPTLNTVIILAVIGTIIASSYFIKYNQNIYARIGKIIQRLDTRIITRKVSVDKSDIECNILLIGYNDINAGIFSKLSSLGKTILVIENDPEKISLLKNADIPFVYCSMSDASFFENHKIVNLEILISSITDEDVNKLILREIKKKYPSVTVIMAAKSLKSSMELYDCKADYVIYQTQIHDQVVSAIIEDYTINIQRILTKKINDIIELKKREEKMSRLGKSEVFEIGDFLKKMLRKTN